jgi:hypothetical protein
VRADKAPLAFTITTARSRNASTWGLFLGHESRLRLFAWRCPRDDSQAPYSLLTAFCCGPVQAIRKSLTFPRLIQTLSTAAIPKM